MPSYNGTSTSETFNAQTTATSFDGNSIQPLHKNALHIHSKHKAKQTVLVQWLVLIIRQRDTIVFLHKLVFNSNWETKTYFINNTLKYNSDKYGTNMHGYRELSSTKTQKYVD